MHQKGFLFLCTFLAFSVLIAQNPFLNINKQQALNQENQKITRFSQQMEKFYHLEDHQSWREITEEVLASPETSQMAKDSIRNYKRRIFVFKYPSDDLWIKGFISFTPDPQYHPLLILLRGGTENFGLLHPGIIFATYGNYTVLSSTLRGGVSEGHDEYGGADVNDIHHLIAYLPSLAKELGISLDPHCIYMLGLSRGGLEMFLSLARYPVLQNYVNKVVALSALLDLHRQIEDRPDDMKEMFKHHFGFTASNAKQWIAQRDPLETIPYLKKSLPILIIQGTDDQRINPAEGRHMYQALKTDHHAVYYWEIPQGRHVLLNKPYIMEKISTWLKANSTCEPLHP
jgi:dipeptidyl aminopeptidase/acylaminoacyl peptidase